MLTFAAVAALQTLLPPLAAAQSIYDSQPTTTVVPNRLKSVRELLHEQLRVWLPKVCVAVTRCDFHEGAWAMFCRYAVDEKGCTFTSTINNGAYHSTFKRLSEGLVAPQ